MFDAVLKQHGWSADQGCLQRALARETPLLAALALALDLAGEPSGALEPWQQAMQEEARRRLYPRRFGPPPEAAARVAERFFPLAQAVLPRLADPDSIAARLPFQPLAEDERAPWPSGEEYRRLLGHLDDEGFLVTLAMAQHWQGLTIQDHVLGVTGLALWLGRQLARAIPVDLPLLHGGAIGHDVGKFGCVGLEARRTPRLHYYYTHQYYADRGLGGLGHIATNHSCWDLERIRLPIETQILIYCDFRVKEVMDGQGRRRMAVISLKDAFAAILDKLENVDQEKFLRYRAVYGRLRDMEAYALTLGVALEPPGFPPSRRPRPYLPEGLDIVALMAGRQRPDAAVLATGAQVPGTARLLATAHSLGVMARLRDLPSLRRLLEEIRSFRGWRELRTYLGILGDYAPALSEEQRALVLGFYRELLGHADDDIRYQAACRMADLLALGDVEWRKDLPEGVVVEGPSWVLPQVAAVLDLLDLAPGEAAEDMSPQEQILYSVPIFLRRFFSQASPRLVAEALPMVVARLRQRAGDRRPLAALYTCESFELLAGALDAPGREALPKLVMGWAFHDVSNVRLMAWRVLHLLAQHGQREPGLAQEVGGCVDALAGHARASATVAELFLLERCARLTGREALAERCRDLRETGRAPIREVMLRNLKTRTGWVEKKVACDYLLFLVSSLKGGESAVAAEVAFHFANLLKVSRVEGTRFNAGRCLLGLLPALSDPQRNDLAIELVRSLQLDGEGVTRYIPRFLGPLLASLPLQELDELLDDMAQDARRGAEGLQRLLVQAAAWLIIALPAEGMGRLERIAGFLLGSLADSRLPVAHEGYANLALLLEWLRPGPDPRLPALLALATKKILTLVTHLPSDRGRFFLVAQVLSSLDKALAAAPVTFPRAPRVGFLPGTFDPFTSAHGEMVRRALAHCDEVYVQVDDFSWRKHAQPRFLRDELAWMALSVIPGGYLFPFNPPVNIARPGSLERLRQRLGRRQLNLIIGSDVLEGASAYRDPASSIWKIPHLVTTREEQASRRWESRLGQFQAGVQVFQVPSRMKGVSSTSLREAFDRRGELELFCDPLIARILRERRLYVNYPARKEEVFASQWELRCHREGGGLPPALEPLSRLDATRAMARWTGRRPRTAVLSSRDSGEELAALTWLEGAAAALPVALEDESLAELAGGRLLGAGALVEAVGASREDQSLVHLDQLLARIIGQWSGEGLLFALFGVPEAGGERLWEMLRNHGAGWLGGPASPCRGLRWAGIELTHPLVMVHDLEQLLQPPYFRMAPVEGAFVRLRRALASFFAERLPGSGLLHIHEKETKRQLAAWAQERLDGRSGWVVLGLGRQFSRDIVGNSPTLALDLERYLTRQGYEAGIAPAYGSPGLELQLTTARELGRDALLLVPFLDSAEPVLMVMAACRKVRIRLREVLVGATSASVHAALQLSGVPHRIGLVVPHWRGVVRESAVVPFVGGWSIQEPRVPGHSLTPSINDCLPYHDPHPLGLDPAGALDFSRLALEQAILLFQVLEEAFRASEGRLLTLDDLPAMVRTPRCPPFPKGFVMPRDRAPSELLNQDLEALARLLPEAHQAHREGWRRG
ncbi:MAG: adenylyltransferase/cytidyltransferase family protein [Holophaga sp.]|nr:adenylyltransferase/cytidyltransferase family protein [Holophaga sp.]